MVCLELRLRCCGIGDLRGRTFNYVEDCAVGIKAKNAGWDENTRRAQSTEVSTWYLVR